MQTDRMGIMELREQQEYCRRFLFPLGVIMIGREDLEEVVELVLEVLVGWLMLLTMF